MAEETRPSGVSSTSSSGPNGAFPAELNRWNWGAFFLSWIWAIGNSVWIGLLALIPFLNLIMMIVLGIKGSEWAWQYRKFKGVDDFKAVQGAWSKWGIILFFVGLGLSIISWIIVAILGITLFGSTVNTIQNMTPTTQTQFETNF